MEELKLLIEMVADLPAMALWVIAGYFIYKMAIIGSVYGLIRFALIKLKEIIEVRKRPIVKDVDIGGMCISTDGTYQSVVQSLSLVRSHVDTCSGTYLHMNDARWLHEAIQEKIEKEKEN